MRIALVQPQDISDSPSFVRRHAEELPGEVRVIHGVPPRIGSRPLVDRSPRALLPLLAGLRAGFLPGRGRRLGDWGVDCGYLAALDRIRPDVVLAEFGPYGALVRAACRRRGIPLVVHFHGYDATRRALLDAKRAAYQRMFRDAAAVVASSDFLAARLLALGAPAEKLHMIPYGADCQRFAAADPRSAPPVFVAAGRFVGKKAPHRTLLAFSRVAREVPEAELRMIGHGPLLPICRDLARDLGLAERVHFLGNLPHDAVAKEMRSARAFVQHSVIAADGDCEGTPVAVLEAGASGLPVVSTRHSGIPEVVIEGETGLLVGEGDVAGMARAMLQLAREPELAGELGEQAARHIRARYTSQQGVARLAALLEQVVADA